MHACLALVVLPTTQNAHTTHAIAFDVIVGSTNATVAIIAKYVNATEKMYDREHKCLRSALEFTSYCVKASNLGLFLNTL